MRAAASDGALRHAAGGAGGLGGLGGLGGGGGDGGDGGRKHFESTHDVQLLPGSMYGLQHFLQTGGAHVPFVLG